MKMESWKFLSDNRAGNKIEELDHKLKKKRFTYKQVQEIINKAQKRTSKCILDDIKWGQKKKHIANKIKNDCYVGDSLITLYYDLEKELENE